MGIISKRIIFLISLIIFSFLSFFLFTTSTNATVTEGLIAYWKLDEGSGTIASDSSGNSLNGSLINSPIWDNGMFSHSINFDGVNDYVRVLANPTLVRENSSVTVSFWMKREGGGSATAGMVCKKYDTWCEYGMDQPANPRVLIRNASGAKSYNSGFNVDLNVWTHIAFSINDNGVNATVKTYKNGVLITTISNASRIGNRGQELHIGRKDLNYFDGSLDEIRIYNRALSDIEIQELYTGSSPSPSPTLSPTPSASPTLPPTPSPSPTLSPTPSLSPSPSPTPILTPTPSPLPGNSFNLIVLPDTQKYARYYPDIYTSQTQWIANNIQALNIAYVLHEGDIVDQSTETIQWDNAVSSMGVLDPVIHYTVAVGNHDFPTNDTRNYSSFNTYFPVSKYQSLPTFGGTYQPNKHENSYYYFSAGGIDFMVISLEFGPRNAVLDWANQVATANPTKKVIVLTHDYLYYDNTHHGSNPSHLYGPEYWNLQDANNGLQIWEKFVRKHSNIVFVFSGHVHTTTDGAGTLISIGDYGNKVYQMMANYQDFTNGGNGYLRVVTINPTDKTVAVKTYSPYLNQYMTDVENQFSFANVTFGEADTTPPTTVNDLYIVSVAETQVTLSWSPANDPESQISYYRIYRNGSPLTTTNDISYTDSGLSENTTYTYTVAAVNGTNTEGSQSNTVSATTLTDTTPPQIVTAKALSATSVQVEFSEELSLTSAQLESNYSIDQGINVLSATLSTDYRKVTLSTSNLSENSVYTLTVNNVSDRSQSNNPVLPNSQVTFSYITIPTNGLVGYWKLDENSGVTAVDSSGSNYIGTTYNSPLWVTGKVLGGLNFDGANDYLAINNSTSLTRSNSSVSISLWMKRETSSTTYAGIICKRYGTTCEYGLDKPEAPRVIIRNSSGSKSYDSGIIVDQDVWTHIAITIEDTGVGTNIKTYKNGSLAKTFTGVRIGTKNEGMYLGRRDNFYYHGSLDEVRIYNRVLNQSEINNLFLYTGSN